MKDLASLSLLILEFHSKENFVSTWISLFLTMYFSSLTKYVIFVLYILVQYFQKQLVLIRKFEFSLKNDTENNFPLKTCVYEMRSV